MNEIGIKMKECLNHQTGVKPEPVPLPEASG